MSRVGLPITLAALLAFVIFTPTAQGLPDFGGRWVAVEPASVAGHELRITQDDSTLTLEQQRLQSKQAFDTLGRRQGHAQGSRESTTYRLDGKPVISSTAAHGEQQVRSSLRWEKDRLMLVDAYQGSLVRFERTLAFDKLQRLVVEQRRPAAAADQPADESSSRILEPARIVYEKRP